jgi:hypothetical protein
MPSTINASTASGGGIISSADSSGVLELQTAGTTALTIATSGNVGIGTGSPTIRLQVNGASGVTRGVVMQAASDNGAYLLLTDTGSHEWYVGTPNSTNALVFGDSRNLASDGTERMRIDSAGNVGIGVSNPVEKLQVAGAGRFTSSATSLDVVGAFIDYSSSVARISGQATAGGTLAFYTNPNAGFQAERMRIDSSGNVGIGVTPQTQSTGKVLEVGRSGNGIASWFNNNNFVANMYYDSADKFAGTGFALQYYQDASNGVHVWRKSSASGSAGGTASMTEAARIDSSNNFLVGTTLAASSSNTFSVGSAKPVLTLINSALADSTNALNCIKAGSTSNTSQRYIGFGYNGGANGNGAIAGNGDSQATFVTASDARLKKNIQELPSQLANIMALRPVEFDYIASGGHQIGFIAQEVQEVYPDLVSEDDEGFLNLAGLDKNSSRLIKAIQEQQAIITELKARIEALEIK